jgi:hypothetical protein
MAYNPFQAAKPAGSDTGPTVVSDANRNDKALRDATIALMFDDFEFSISAGTGTTRRPQYMYWKNGTGGSAPWIRATITWGTTSGEKYNPTGIVWDYSADGGGAWDTIATQALTFDSNGDLTAISGGSTALAMLSGLLGHVHRMRDDYDTHAAATGASVHGLGTMSTQAASAVAITGGAIKAKVQQGVEKAYGNQSGAFNIDLTEGHFFTFTVTNAAAVATFTNKPASGTYHPIHLRIVNGGIAGATLFSGETGPGGTALSLSSSGTDDVFGYMYDGATFEITGTAKAKAAL